MAKKTEVKKAPKFVPAVKVMFRCNKCGKVAKDKTCCTKNDYTQQLI